jgi:hypothetical protein
MKIGTQRGRVARFFVAQYSKTGENIPNDHTLYQIPIKYKYQMAGKFDQMAIKYTKYTIARPSKIYPNWDFWFETIPSGNPAARQEFEGGNFLWFDSE